MYHEYCKERGWPKGNARSFPGRIEAEIENLFGISVSNNVHPELGTGDQRGWHGIRIKGADAKDPFFSVLSKYSTQ